MINDFLEYLGECDEGSVMLGCVLVGIVFIMVVTGIYQCIPCRWGGPHDWQEIGEPARIQVNAGTLKIYNRVCLACEKIDLQADPYLKAQKDEANQAAARKERAEMIVFENKHGKLGR